MAFRITIVLCLLAFSVPVRAQQPPVAKAESDATRPGPSAATIDFALALEIGSPSLRTLGARIDSARRALDPIGLASAARELAAAEAASGKTAKIAALDLMLEAVDLARARGRLAELKTVAALAEKAGEPLREDIERARRREADRAAAASAGEIARDAPVLLRVVNQSLVAAEVVYCGHRVGTVPSRGVADFSVADPPGPFCVLDARGADGRRWNLRLVGRYESLEWTLHENVER